MMRRFSTSSKQWFDMHSNDHFVRQAHRQSLRSRASFKLLDLLHSYPRLLRRGNCVVDLGASPGGWSQIAVAAVSSRGAEYLRKGGRFNETLHGNTQGDGKVVAVDLDMIDPLLGVQSFIGDMRSEMTQEKVLEICGGQVDVVLSDMAHQFTGSRTADVHRVMVRTLNQSNFLNLPKELCKAAFSFSERVLKPKGNFVCKFFQSSEDDELYSLLKRRFHRVVFEKPLGSKLESSEGYMVCLDYLGTSKADHTERSPDAIEKGDSLLFPRVIARAKRDLPPQLNDTPRKQPPAPIPHWKQLIPGTSVRIAVLRNSKEGVKYAEGMVDALLSRDYHPSGVRVRLQDGSVGRACEILSRK